jgi:protein MpaA
MTFPLLWWPGDGGNRSAASRTLKLLITAGIHGDEPAGVLALYKYVMSLSLRELPVEVHAFPCINPVGLLRNSRVSSGHFDLNRQMTRNSIAPEVRAVISTLDRLATTFDAAFDLQEDNPALSRDAAPNGPEANAFFLYESNFDPLRASIGAEISRAVAKAGIAVASQRSIYGERSLNGVIQRGMERDQVWDIERFLTMNVTNHAITLKTPVSATLSERIKAQTTALECGIQALM